MSTSFHQVLAIETSCDDTSVAVVGGSGLVLGMRTASQDEDHLPFGGVVPEIAGRSHTLSLLPVIDQLLQELNMQLSDIDGIAVTNRPGLVGSLLVGLMTAKSLSMSLKIPFIGVNHLEGHLMAPFLSDESYQPPEDFQMPCVALAISGGHTSLYKVMGFGEYHLMGATIDDAAGEAFDKLAKLLGLGFPGGVQVDRLSQKGDPHKFSFPRPLIREENYHFSFSGLKTSAQRLVDDIENIEEELPHLCASFQEAIVDVLLHKLNRLVQESGFKRVMITGGVSANSRLREKSALWAEENGLTLVVPPLRYCTDNAAMIGWAGLQRLRRGETSALNLSPCPRPYDSDFVSQLQKRTK